MNSKKLLYICVTAVLVLSVLAMFTVNASAEEGGSRIYAVHPTDPGANYTNIQAAIGAASDGDSIEVWNSTYDEHVEVQKQLNKHAFDSE